MAERGGHAPHTPEAHDFISKESRLARPVHVPENGAPGWNFARNLRVRSAALSILSYGSFWMVDRMAEAGGHAPHTPEAYALFSRQSRRACPVQLPVSGRSGWICTSTWRLMKPPHCLLCYGAEKMGRPAGLAPARRLSQSRMLNSYIMVSI